MGPQDAYAALPQQLLVQALKHLHVQDRLKCALVCTAWREAASQATTDISISCKSGGPKKCAALTSWLLHHGTAAAVESITVAADDYTMTGAYSHPLVLPLQHLPALRKLDAHMFAVAAVPSSDAAAAAAQASTQGSPRFAASVFLLPVELSALTHLGLTYSFMQLTALPTFTNLQRLELDESVYSPGNPFTYGSNASNVAALQHALPQLQQLTGLRLGYRYTSDAVMGTLRYLSRLQDLQLISSICTEAAFAAGALPNSLTRLKFDGILGSNDRTLSPSSTPGFAQLTALQSLSVGSVRVFDAALVQPLTALTHLYVLNCYTPPTGMAVLSGLQQLRCLVLSSRALPSVEPGSALDVGALTASSHLTQLGIGLGLVQHDQYIHLFPPGRRLPHLQDIWATRGLLSSVATVNSLVQACPNLRSLHLQHTNAAEPGAGTAEDDSGFEMHSWASLMGLTKLTSLSLNMEGMTASQMDWCWIGCLESLQKLDVGQIGWGLIGGILSLTRCRELRLLRLRFESRAYLLPDHFAGKSTQLELKNQAPEGLPPDVWCQLPYAVLTAAQRRLSESHPLDNHDSPDEVLKAVMHEATSYLWVLNEQHRKQQQELKQQMQAMQVQFAKEQEQRQQEVGGLRGALAAMAAQMQAMQQQLQQHLGR